MKTIIALAVIAAASIRADQPELTAGHRIAGVPDDVADKLIAAGQFREATAAETADVDSNWQSTQPTTTAGKARNVKARLLVDGEHGDVNDVVELPAAAAKQLQDSGQADTHKDAIAYAMTLPQNQAKA